VLYRVFSNQTNFFDFFFVVLNRTQHTQLARTHLVHIYMHRKKVSYKWAPNSKPCNHESDALPLH